MDYLKELKDAFFALDDALGGNDADVESDEEERENYPTQYAARIISGVIQDMEKAKRRRTKRAPDARKSALKKVSSNKKGSAKPARG